MSTTSAPAGLAAASYHLMARVGGAVIPPTAVATLATTLATGLALSLLTPWGLVRHWWVVMLTVATVVSVDKPWGRTPYGRRRRAR